MQTELDPSLNVLGEPLKPCSFDPMTGFFRDGCCNTGPEDRGRHTVCVRVTAEFLAFSRAPRQRPLHPAPGIRLPRPQPRRPLVPLRRCAGSEAWEAGAAPKVVLASTHAFTLGIIPLEVLQAHAMPGRAASTALQPPQLVVAARPG